MRVPLRFVFKLYTVHIESHPYHWPRCLCIIARGVCLYRTLLISDWCCYCASSVHLFRFFMAAFVIRFRVCGLCAFFIAAPLLCYTCMYRRCISFSCGCRCVAKQRCACHSDENKQTSWMEIWNLYCVYFGWEDERNK